MYELDPLNLLGHMIAYYPSLEPLDDRGWEVVHVELEL